ncbi:MAG: DUF1688 family protein [Synechococcales bacterium]|nr:DUF1688 family protein [Synechococcales bacterium]
MTGTSMTIAELDCLQSPVMIRDRAHQLFELGLADELQHFQVHFDRLDRVVDYVIDLSLQQYDTVSAIPFHSRWRHFPTDRIYALFADLNPIDRAKAKFELVIPSVLLDAGAGADWSYTDATGKIWYRSEGLAIASLDLFVAGTFSRSRCPQTDAIGLQQLSLAQLQQALQVRDDNPLLGLVGRWQLLQKLGQQGTCHRLGDLVDLILAERGDRIAADRLFHYVLDQMGHLWQAPGDVGLYGDVGFHRAIGWMPFHKLAQWLTYSLMEPLQELGMTIDHLDRLTGLAEYRNGGLCLDLGLLQLKHPEVAQSVHPITAELIVEWRGLTIAALDHIADRMREKLACTAAELPLVKILQGGTWSAGRAIAQTLRPQATPPLQILSDGSFF